MNFAGAPPGDAPVYQPRDPLSGRPLPSRLTKLLIADSQALVCDGLASLCHQSGEFDVVSKSSDGIDTWQKIERLNPALAILDLALPRLFAGEILRKCRAASSSTRCLILAPRPDRKAVVEALRAGAQAFLLKSDSGAQLLEALRQVRTGGVYVSPSLPIQTLFIPKRNQQAASTDPFDSLSAREHQVFTLLVAGYRAKEIAATLDLSPKTVDTYRSNLMRKLDIRDVASLVKFAMHRNLTETT